MTCRSPPISFMILPMELATSPDTPVSISSKIIVRPSDAESFLMESISLESSPPDATFLSGSGERPGLALKRISNLSNPLGVGSARFSKCNSKEAFFIFNEPRSCSSDFENSDEASLLFLLNSSPALRTDAFPISRAFFRSSISSSSFSLPEMR